MSGEILPLYGLSNQNKILLWIKKKQNKYQTIPIVQHLKLLKEIRIQEELVFSG